MPVKKRKLSMKPEAVARRKAEAKKMKNPAYRAAKKKKAIEYRRKNAAKLKKYAKEYSKQRRRMRSK